MKITITAEAVDWFFSRDECSFADKDKALKICKLRLQGVTYPEIAKEVNLSIGAVRRYTAYVQNSYERMLKREEVATKQKKSRDALKDVYELIAIEYVKAKEQTYIKKPLAYALHKVWARVDKRKQERRNV